jgi:hypothetical protein
MPTSTEQINELIGGYTALKLFFEGAEDAINERLNAAAATWANDGATFYVDTQAGNDANDGTDAAPLLTWQEAINRTPPRGRCSIISRSDVTLTHRVQAYGRIVQITSAEGAEWAVPSAENRPNLNATPYDSGGAVHIPGFSCAYDGGFDINGFKVNWPSEAAVSAALPGAVTSTAYTAFFVRENSSRGAPGYVALRNCDIVLPLDPLGHLLANVPGFNFYAWSVTWSADRTGLVTPFGVGGANTETIGHLLTTNYATL